MTLGSKVKVKIDIQHINHLNLFYLHSKYQRFRAKDKNVVTKTHAVRLELEELTNNMSPFIRTEDIKFDLSEPKTRPFLVIEQFN